MRAKPWRWGMGLIVVIGLILLGQQELPIGTMPSQHPSVETNAHRTLPLRHPPSPSFGRAGSSSVQGEIRPTFDHPTSSQAPASSGTPRRLDASALPGGSHGATAQPPTTSPLATGTGTASSQQLFGIPADPDTGTDADPLIDDSPSISVDNPTPGVGLEEGILVTSVIDGDTVELESGERVRYIGIDTPETTLGKNDCYGQAATERNRELVEGQRVQLERDVEPFDKYGRTLAYVYVDDLFINQTLVAEGFASTLTIPPNVRLADHFAQLAAQAREEGRGLWGACESSATSSSTSSGSTSRPDYNETIPQAATTNCPPDQPIKGNAQSMIYHVPGGEFYERTKPEACFATEPEATTAGYRKSKR